MPPMAARSRPPALEEAGYHAWKPPVRDSSQPSVDRPGTALAATANDALSCTAHRLLGDAPHDLVDRRVDVRGQSLSRSEVAPLDAKDDDARGKPSQRARKLDRLGDAERMRGRSRERGWQRSFVRVVPPDRSRLGPRRSGIDDDDRVRSLPVVEQRGEIPSFTSTRMSPDSAPRSRLAAASPAPSSLRKAFPAPTITVEAAITRGGRAAA